MNLFGWVVGKRGKGAGYCALCRLPLNKCSDTSLMVSHGSGFGVCAECEETAKAINKITCGYFIMRSHIEHGYPSALPEDCKKGGDWLKRCCEMNDCWDGYMKIPGRGDPGELPARISISEDLLERLKKV